MRILRIMFVLPLIATTCFVAVLNGNVLCMAGADHVAVEAAHEDRCCPASVGHAGHDDAEPHPEGCSDVSAELDLLRAEGRSGVDAAAVAVPFVWAGEPHGNLWTDLSSLPIRRSRDAAPATARRRVVESVVLII